MTKNFSILQDYDVSIKHQEDIKKVIEKIENTILKNDLDYMNYIYIEGGKILEKIFKNIKKTILMKH